MPRRFFLILILLSQAIAGQEIVFENKGDIIAEQISRNFNGAVFYEEERDYFLLNFLDDNVIRTCLFDNEFRLVKNKIIQKEIINFGRYVESFGTNKKHAFVFRKKSGKKFYAITYDFEEDISFQKPLDFKLKNEDFLSTFSQNEKFYILSRVEDTRVLRLHTIDVDLNYDVKEIDINKSEFYLNGNKLPAIPPLRKGYKDPVFHFPYNRGGRLLTALNPNTPLPNSLVTESNKFYVRANKVIMTLDFDNDQNILIEINLTDYTSVLKKTLRISDEKFKSSNAKSNSFLFKDKLFLFKGDKRSLYLRIMDIVSNTIIHEDKYDQFFPYLPEKNLMVKLSDYLSHKEEDETKQTSVKKKFSKLVKSKDKMGIRVTEGEDSYLLSFGVYGERSISIPIAGAALSPVLALTAAINFSFEKEDSLDFYIEKEGYALTYDTLENPFTQMDRFLKETYENKEDGKVTWKTFFKRGDDYIVGYYEKKRSKFYLRKFN